MSKRFATNPAAPKAARKKKGNPLATPPPPSPEAVVRDEFAARVDRAAKRADALIEKLDPAHNSLAPDPDPEVTSSSTTTQAAGILPAAKPETGRSMKQMDLKLVKSTAPRKSQRIVIYNIEGRTGSVQFLSTLFGGSQKDPGNPPETLTLSGEFAEPKVAAPKVKETPEERKARLAALPKPTLAEKIARAEKRAEELRAKLAKQGEGATVA